MKIFYTAKAERDLSSFPLSMQKRVAVKMSLYASQPDPLRFAKALVIYNVYRFRVGDLRVIFEVQNNTIFVLKIVKRDKAYRDF